MTDLWQSGAGYEAYVGRWSRLVAERFIGDLAIPTGARWVDVGSGTGAVTTKEGIIQEIDDALELASKSTLRNPK